jgi:hypothetical protein
MRISPRIRAPSNLATTPNHGARENLHIESNHPTGLPPNRTPDTQNPSNRQHNTLNAAKPDQGADLPQAVASHQPARSNETRRNSTEKHIAAAGTDPDREEPELTRADLDRGAEGEGERGGRGDGSGEAKVSTFCSERLGTTPWVFFFFLAPGVPRFCGAVRGRV